MEQETSWPVALSRTIASQVRALRTARGLSAQQLSDRCEQVGMPVPRAVISNLENGRRESVSVAELFVLACALRVPPVVLLFPVGTATDLIEFLPGATAVPWDAMKWFTGEGPVPKDDERGEDWQADAAPVNLFREHESQIDQLRNQWRRSQAPANPAQREAELQVSRFFEDAILAKRQEIRSVGYVPPPLPADLAWLESESGNLKEIARMVGTTVEMHGGQVTIRTGQRGPEEEADE